LWHHRNGVVHGATVDEQVQRRLSHLRNQITQHYATFAENPNYLLARHHRLFTYRPVEECINTSYDAMAAWLRSVEEALQVVQHHDTRLREVSQAFFGRPNPAEEVSDSDLSYSDSRQSADEETPSIDSTEATTVAYKPCLLRHHLPVVPTIYIMIVTMIRSARLKQRLLSAPLYFLP